ncbi:MAG: hypothetical protein IKF51_00600 [Solobacterium sp.]|nr:hypothetical protein [Solobacterium sp.]
MMFAERLTKLLDTLEVPVTGLAAYAKMDRTSISRMKSGSREPKKDGISIRKLLQGIIVFCAENGKTDQLRTLTGAEEDASDEELMQALKLWLYKDSAVDNKEKPVIPAVQNSAHTFGTRLNAVMDLADISNIRLSRLVYADASLISRYRRSERRPKSGSNMARRITRVLWERLEKEGRISELCELMKTSEADEQAFYAWLFENEKQAQPAMIIPEKMLTLLNTRTPMTQAVRQELPALPEIEVRDIYYGTEGLRSAALRFLKYASEHQVPQMYLYSDEKMNWLSGDPQFFRLWGALMQRCIQNHTKITIIHYVKRNMNELNDAIAGWLPLYLSGMISSYFCRKDERFPFVNTIFLIPGSACIRASHVQGMEADGIYHYHTDSRSLTQFEKEYRSLITQASPLFAILPGMHVPEENKLVILRNTLPLGAMSGETVSSFHDDQLYSVWEAVRYRADETFTEFIPVRDPEEQIFTEAIEGAPRDVYTPEQYQHHLEDIRRLASEDPGYVPVFLAQCPFDNVRIYITETKVSVIRIDPSPVTFETSHPQMRQAFLDYTLRLRNS